MIDTHRWHRERLADAGLAGLLLLAAPSLLVGPVPVGERWPGVALTAAVAVAMFWRRRHPELVAAGAVLAVLLGASEFALGAGLLSLAVRRRDRVLALLGAAAVAVLAYGWVVHIQPADPVTALLGLVLTSGFFVGLPIAGGAYIGARRALVASLRERAERAEAEQRMRGEQARRAERARIAREMHDVLAHRISLMSLHAGGLEVNPASPPEEVERVAALIGENGRQALADLRDVLGVLRADVAAGDELAPQPTLAGVPDLVTASREAGVPVELDADLVGDPPVLVGRTAYRVVQEGLTNAHKHATGAAVYVVLLGAPGRGLTVELRNARAVGTALRPTTGSGMGLVGLRERVQLVGGTFEAGGGEHGGFIVRAVLPWPA